VTSARLRDWWLPNQLGDHVLLATTRSDVHVQRAGLYVRRSRYAEVEPVNGLPIMTVAQTLVELARDLTLLDLVPMVDCALAAGASPDEILAAARPRAQGAITLRRAVGLADPRSESWWESVLRLLHVVAGLGPVECQVDVIGRNGVVGRADLHLVGTDRYPECDGGEHRTRARHLSDLRRDKAMHRLGAERYGYTTLRDRPAAPGGHPRRGGRPGVPARPAAGRPLVGGGARVQPHGVRPQPSVGAAPALPAGRRPLTRRAWRNPVADTRAEPPGRATHC
jgi:hypothetical protein